MVKAQRLREKYDAETARESNYLSDNMADNSKKEGLLQELENDWDDASEDNDDDDEIDSMFSKKLLKSAQSQPPSVIQVEKPAPTTETSSSFGRSTSDLFSRFCDDDDDEENEADYVVRKVPDKSNLDSVNESLIDDQSNEFSDKINESDQESIGLSNPASHSTPKSSELNVNKLTTINTPDEQSLQKTNNTGIKPLYMPRVLSLKKNKYGASNNLDKSETNKNILSSSKSSEEASFSEQLADSPHKAESGKMNLENLKRGIQQGKSYFIHSYRKELLQQQKQKDMGNKLSEEKKAPSTVQKTHSSGIPMSQLSIINSYTKSESSDSSKTKTNTNTQDSNNLSDLSGNKECHKTSSEDEIDFTKKDTPSLSKPVQLQAPMTKIFVSLNNSNSVSTINTSQPSGSQVSDGQHVKYTLAGNNISTIEKLNPDGTRNLSQDTSNPVSKPGLKVLAVVKDGKLSRLNTLSNKTIEQITLSSQNTNVDKTENKSPIEITNDTAQNPDKDQQLTQKQPLLTSSPLKIITSSSPLVQIIQTKDQNDGKSLKDSTEQIVKTTESSIAQNLENKTPENPEHETSNIEAQDIENTKDEQGMNNENQVSESIEKERIEVGENETDKNVVNDEMKMQEENVEKLESEVDKTPENKDDDDMEICPDVEQEINESINDSMETASDKSPSKNLALFPELKTNFKIPKKRPLENESPSKVEEIDTSLDSSLNSSIVSEDDLSQHSPLAKKQKKQNEMGLYSQTSNSDTDKPQTKDKDGKPKAPFKIKGLIKTSSNQSGNEEQESKSTDSTGDSSSLTSKHMQKLKDKVKMISKKLTKELKGSKVYSTFDSRIQNDEILILLQYPDEDKISYSKVKDPKPGEFYIFSYPQFVNDINCDNYQWRNKGVKLVYTGENRLKKIYFGNLENPSFKKKVAYFENTNNRKYMCVYYEEGEKQEDYDHNQSKPERPADNATLYMTDIHELRRDEIIRILTQPEIEKVAKTQVKSPRGGDVLVFSTEHIPMTDYRCDSYTWHMNGVRDMPGAASPCKRIHYSISLGKGKMSNKFRKKEYYFVDESLRKFVLVHYVGDETIYVPHSHGNSKTSKKIYKRTCPSLIAKIKHMTEISKPADGTKRKLSEESNEYRKRLKTKDDLNKENPELLKVISAKKRLSSIDIYNLNLLAYNLNGFVRCLDLYPSLVCVLGLEDLLVEFNKLLEVKTEAPLLCMFESSTKLQNYYVTPIVFQHVAFEGSPVIPLAFLIHQDNEERLHCRFLQVMMDFISNMTKIMIPIVITTNKQKKEAVKKKLSFWPVLHSWKNLQDNFYIKMKEENIKDENDINKYSNDVLKLLQCESEKQFSEVENTVLQSWPESLKNYYNKDLGENIAEHSGRWVLEAYSCYCPNIGINIKTCSELHGLFKELQGYKVVPIDVTVIALYLLQTKLYNDLKYCAHNEGKYKFKPDFKDLVFPTEIKPDAKSSIDEVKHEDLVETAEEYSSYHLTLSENLSEYDADKELAIGNNATTGVMTETSLNPEVRNSRSRTKQLLIDSMKSKKEIIKSLVDSAKCETSRNLVEVLSEELKNDSDKNH